MARPPELPTIVRAGWAKPKRKATKKNEFTENQLVYVQHQMASGYPRPEIGGGMPQAARAAVDSCLFDNP